MLRLANVAASPFTDGTRALGERAFMMRLVVENGLWLMGFGLLTRSAVKLGQLYLSTLAPTARAKAPRIRQPRRIPSGELVDC